MSPYFGHRLTLLYQAVGDNNDELVQHLEETAHRLLAVERMVVSGVPKAAKKAMENLKSYVVFRALKGYYTFHHSGFLGKK